MQLVSPAPGSIASARVHLGKAQGHAGAVIGWNGDIRSHLEGGVAAAKRAASELFLAEPRSPFQDLVAARRQVIEGQQLLQQAFAAFTSPQMGPDPMPYVKQLAREAFDSFENVFEILDND